jgi:hypothetical protein
MCVLIALGSHLESYTRLYGSNMAHGIAEAYPVAIRTVRNFVLSCPPDNAATTRFEMFVVVNTKSCFETRNMVIKQHYPNSS